MDDLISRQAAIDAIAHATFDVTIGGRRGFIDYKKEFEKAFVAIRDKYIEALEALPSAEPEIVWCKECKYWKDSDGVYRRGFDAESKCPLNLKKVYEGTFYCGMAERRTDE